MFTLNRTSLATVGLGIGVVLAGCASPTGDATDEQIGDPSFDGAAEPSEDTLATDEQFADDETLGSTSQAQTGEDEAQTDGPTGTQQQEQIIYGGRGWGARGWGGGWGGGWGRPGWGGGWGRPGWGGGWGGGWGRPGWGGGWGGGWNRGWGGGWGGGCRGWGCGGW